MIRTTLQDFKLRLSGATRRQRLILSASLGIASGFSFAPFYFWPLMLLGFLGLVWLVDTEKEARHAAACGWFFGFGQSIVGLYWIAVSFQYQANMPVWLGWIAVLALSGALAIYPAAAVWFSAKLWSPSPARILLFAAFWAVAEWLRGHLLTGFPWNTVAQIWADTPSIMQVLRFVGAYGLTLLTVALFASVALIADRTLAARRALFLAGGIALAVVGDGLWRLSQAPPAVQQRLRVHLIQPNVRQELKADSRRQLEILEMYEGITAAVVERRGPGIVVWPETAVQYDVEGDNVSRIRLARLLAPGGTMILGAVGRKVSADGTWLGSRNSLLVIDSRGAITAVYDKAKLVPFGEYLPGGGWLRNLGLSSVATGNARFVAGKGPVTLAPGLPSFSPLICYEVIFPGAVVDAGKRPSWLLNISNDAWFGNSSGPHQHLAQARLRAVEEGLPVVRSTPTGISAVIDPYGKLVARTGLNEAAVLTADVHPPLNQTVYARVGDRLFLALLLACFVIAIWLGSRQTTKRLNKANENATRPSALE